VEEEALLMWGLLLLLLGWISAAISILSCIIISIQNADKVRLI